MPSCVPPNHGHRWACYVMQYASTTRHSRVDPPLCNVLRDRVPSPKKYGGVPSPRVGARFKPAAEHPDPLVSMPVV